MRDKDMDAVAISVCMSISLPVWNKKTQDKFGSEIAYIYIYRVPKNIHVAIILKINIINNLI